MAKLKHRERIRAIQALVRAEVCPSAAELAERFDVSKRQIFRDFKEIARLGGALRIDPTVGPLGASSDEGPAALEPHELLGVAILRAFEHALLPESLIEAAERGLVKLAHRGVPDTAALAAAETVVEWSAPGIDLRDGALATMSVLVAAAYSHRPVRLHYLDDRGTAALAEVTAPRVKLFGYGWIVQGRDISAHRSIEIPLAAITSAVTLDQ